jgi:hypothetical protein
LFPPFLIIAIIWTVFGIIRFGYDLIDWYCDAWLITSISIIDLEWKGIFDHTSSRIEYAATEGVAYEIRGFWGTVLKYGTTQIAKISNGTPTVLEYAANPKKIELKILEYKELFNEKKGKQDTEGIKQILADMVARHIKENGLPKDKPQKNIDDDIGEIMDIDIDEPPEKQKQLITIENLEEGSEAEAAKKSEKNNFEYRYF